MTVNITEPLRFPHSLFRVVQRSTVDLEVGFNPYGTIRGSRPLHTSPQPFTIIPHTPHHRLYNAFHPTETDSLLPTIAKIRVLKLHFHYCNLFT